MRDEDADEQDAAEAKGWTHIFASPEALLQSVKWRKMLLDPDLVNGLVALRKESQYLSSSGTLSPIIIVWLLSFSLAVVARLGLTLTFFRGMRIRGHIA